MNIHESLGVLHGSIPGTNMFGLVASIQHVRLHYEIVDLAILDVFHLIIPPYKTASVINSNN